MYTNLALLREEALAAVADGAAELASEEDVAELAGLIQHSERGGRVARAPAHRHEPPPLQHLVILHYPHLLTRNITSP